MSRKMIITLCCCYMGATLFVLTLYAATQKAVHEPQNFLRTYQKAAALKASELDVKYNSWYIAGITDEHIYLGNIMAPKRLLITNHALTDTQHVHLKIKGNENQKMYAGTRVLIHPPYFYIADGILPALFRGRLGEWEAGRFMYDSAYFNAIVPVSPTSFGIRATSSATFENVLGKVQHTSPHVTLEPGLLQRQVDGYFCTDGIMLYNTEQNKLIYTYYYRNGYVVYDTSMSLTHRGHTIDTFSRAQVKVGHISSSNTKKLTYKKYVNREASTSGNYLYINSRLLAKNDQKNMLTGQSVIDVYDFIGDRYRFSFTIPHLKEIDNNMRDFMVFDNRMLVALYDRHLVTYAMQPRYFSSAKL